ncbi:MAG: hypothetical protein UU95_C0005G0026 [Parcubacteria group bacterium GW2011_GWC2_42_12]|nr:MAG: hypothetical protein UU95_C0005G0026 [Parcubacteria group bacterium GW2011_GWC2_42_12]
MALFAEKIKLFDFINKTKNTVLKGIVFYFLKGFAFSPEGENAL